MNETVSKETITLILGAAYLQYGKGQLTDEVAVVWADDFRGEDLNLFKEAYSEAKKLCVHTLPKPGQVAAMLESRKQELRRARSLEEQVRRLEPPKPTLLDGLDVCAAWHLAEEHKFHLNGESEQYPHIAQILEVLNFPEELPTKPLERAQLRAKFHTAFLESSK